MKTMYAFKSVEDMANGKYLATGSGSDLEFVNTAVTYWQQCGYWVTIHCTNDKQIKVVEPEVLTIVNKQPAVKMFAVHGDYCMQVVLARSASEAEHYCSHYDNGEERGYPWDGCKAYQIDEIVGMELAEGADLPTTIVSYIE